MCPAPPLLSPLPSPLPLLLFVSPCSPPPFSFFLFASPFSPPRFRAFFPLLPLPCPFPPYFPVPFSPPPPPPLPSPAPPPLPSSPSCPEKKFSDMNGTSYTQVQLHMLTTHDGFNKTKMTSHMAMLAHNFLISLKGLLLFLASLSTIVHFSVLYLLVLFLPPFPFSLLPSSPPSFSPPSTPPLFPPSPPSLSLLPSSSLALTFPPFPGSSLSPSPLSSSLLLSCLSPSFLPLFLLLFP
jgi:hypothetical protein